MKITEKIRIKSSAPACEAPIKIAFLGDSVTHGCFEIINKGEKGYDCIYDQSAVYHSRLKQRLETVYPNCPVTVINAGISGDNAIGGAARVERDVIDSKPDLCVVCFGLNDVLSPEGKKPYLDGLKAIFEKLKAADIDTIFMTPNMVCTYKMPSLIGDAFLNRMGNDCTRVQTDGTMDDFMSSAKELCKSQDVPVCDCYGAWKRLYANGADVTALLSNSLNHPIREMHTLFADMLFNKIIIEEI